MYEPENEFSDHEYKRNLLFSRDQLAKKSIQLLRRIHQGNGNAKYSIGVEDDGTIFPLSEEEFECSVDNLKEMASMVNAMVIPISVNEVDGKYYGDFDIQHIPGSISYVDIRVVVAGTADAGKSTTIGVLISGKLDNGSGSSRLNVLTHPHEIVNKGRTSDISYKMMGFNEKNEYINGNYRKYSTRDIVRDSTKLITLTDIAGQRKFIGTTASAMTSSQPDYGMLMVNSNSGISMNDTTFDHIQLFQTYSIPFIVVMTMIDITEKERFDNAVKTLRLGLRNFDLKLLSVKNEDDLKNINLGSNFVPIFKISNVTGQGHELLRKFLSELIPRERMNRFKVEMPTNASQEKYVCIPISHIYRQVQGVGTVLSGIVNCGKLTSNQKLFLGPNGNGEYVELKVRSLEINFEKISEAFDGDHVAISFKGKFPDEEITPQKGMVLIGENVPKIASKNFDIRIKILKNNRTRIGVGTKPFGFIGSRKVTFKILEIREYVSQYLPEGDEEGKYLHQNSTALIQCELSRYVFALPGTQVLFHESEMKASGVVEKIL